MNTRIRPGRNRRPTFNVLLFIFRRNPVTLGRGLKKYSPGLVTNPTGIRTPHEARTAAERGCVALVLPKASGLNRKREGREARAADRARLGPTTCRERAASNAAANHGVPHVVRSSCLHRPHVRDTGRVRASQCHRRRRGSIRASQSRVCGGETRSGAGKQCESPRSGAPVVTAANLPCGKHPPRARETCASQDARIHSEPPRPRAHLGDVALGQREEAADHAKVLAPCATALGDVPPSEPQLHSQRKVGMRRIGRLEGVEDGPGDHAECTACAAMGEGTRARQSRLVRARVVRAEPSSRAVTGVARTDDERAHPDDDARLAPDVRRRHRLLRHPIIAGRRGGHPAQMWLGKGVCPARLGRDS